MDITLSSFKEYLEEDEEKDIIKLSSFEEYFKAKPIELQGGITLPETPEIKPLMEGLPISKPEDKPEPTWGEVIKQSLKAGLGQYQASLVNVLRLIDMGVTKLTNPIQNLIPIDPEKAKKFKEKYGKDPYINTNEILTKIVEDSEKISVKSQEQAESKQWLKKLVGTGLQATPQIVGAAVMGTAMPVAGGIAAAKPTAEIATRVSQMIPFGVGAAGGHAREIEKEYEALGKEAPYLKMVAGGLLGGAGEMATELPVFLGVTRLLKTGGKELINEGAKTLISKYGKLGIEFIKNIGLQAWQEAEMEPIQNAIVRAIGLPQEKIIDIKEMGQAAYGGMAMALVLGGLGGGVAGSAKVAEKTGQAVDDFIQNKGDIRETLRVIAEAQGIIPREPEAVALGYKEEEIPPKEIPPIKPPIPPSPPISELKEMAGEPVGDPIAKLNELIKQAKPRRGRLETEYTKERARRIREVERVIDEVGGEQGYKMALGKLKGELVKPEAKIAFEPIKDKLSKPEVDSLYNSTFKHPYLDEWEKISAASELTKLLSGELPTPKGLVLLEEIYGTNLIKSILAKRALGLKITDVLIDLGNLPRAILATADMSAFLRQGIIPVVSHPVISAKAMRKTFQFAFSPKAFDQYFKDLTKDPLYPLMRKSGLSITDPSRVLASGREEAFISRSLQKTPIIGDVVKFAERSYVGFLNKLRVDVFKTFADEFLSKGFSPVRDANLFKATAEVVNTFTGRGSMGTLNRITPQLNIIFFSPRLITARFNALNPTWYIKQPKEMRVKAISDFAKFVATGLTLLAIVSASGLGDVETDPRSSDFGKIKIGNTRWDIWGGFQQWVRVFAQVITGKRKNTATGEIISLTKDEYPFTTRKEVALRFIEGKLAPVPALVNELISGAKTFEGEDITFETVVREKFIPMYIQDIADAYIDGGLGRATGAGITAFFGVGVQTWQERKSKEPFKITLPESGKLTFTKPKLDIKSTKLKFTF